MKNLRYQFGDWIVKNPEAVVKLGFVLDYYKKPKLSQLWVVAEGEALVRMPTFNSGDKFYQEEVDGKDGLLYSFRYYTPSYNRRLKGDDLL